MIVVGIVIGFIITRLVRIVEIRKNRCGCVYDHETRCWHKI